MIKIVIMSISEIRFFSCLQVLGVVDTVDQEGEGEGALTHGAE